ncbi:MAG: GspE/PulE family protein [Candidatus Kerfeldbacteria bacterium]
MKDEDKTAVIEKLREKEALTDEQINTLAEKSREDALHMYDVLITEAIVDEEELAKTEAEVLGIPYVFLIDKDMPVEVLNVFTQDIAENYQVVPFSRDGDSVSVAMADPLNYKAIEALDFIARRDNIKLKYFITSESSVNSVLRQYAGMSIELNDALAGDAEKPMEEQLEEEAADSAVKSAPVSKIVSVILRYAVEGNASDVHIEPMDDETRVRYRVDGVLHTSLQVPKNVHDSVVARIKVLSNLKLDETRLPQDGRFRMSFDKRDIDFRVSTLPLIGREKVVLRILDTESGVQSPEELGYSDRNLEVITEHMKIPHGMLLITGPTGSGKSTTLYAMLQMLNIESRNIITLEDPVEYHIQGISQSQVRPEIGLSFSNGLRSILRQDPDIIMVGEVRDAETAELAVHAALTGHMLLSTLHTNNALGAIPRLVDMGIEPFLISSSLNLIAAQRLVRKICDDCKEDLTLPVEMESSVLVELQSIPKQSLPKDITSTLPLKVSRGKGCERCDNTGYRGRVSISEIIEITDRFKEIIAEGQINQYHIVEEELKRQGFYTLKQDGLIKALRGQTTIEEVWTVTEE